MYSSSCLKGCKSARPCFWNLVLLCACVSRFLQIFSELSTLICDADCEHTCNTTPQPYPERQCGSVQGHSCAQTTSVTPCQPIQAKSVRGEAYAGHNHPWFQVVCAAITRATPLLQSNEKLSSGCGSNIGTVRLSDRPRGGLHSWLVRMQCCRKGIAHLHLLWTGGLVPLKQLGRPPPKDIRHHMSGILVRYRMLTYYIVRHAWYTI
jgi:hypothetical protein